MANERLQLRLARRWYNIWCVEAMNRNMNQIDKRGGCMSQAGAVRKPVLVLCLAVAVIAVGLAVYLLAGGGAKAPEENLATAPYRVGQEPGAAQPLDEAASLAPHPPAAEQAASRLVQAAEPALVPAAPRSLPNAESVQIVAQLSQLDLSGAAITPEAAAAWKQGLQQLVLQGAAGAPAIRDFLEKNLDLNFDSVGGTKLLGQPSLRLGLLDALRQIGGPEALAISSQTLQTATDPREIAFLARHLEQEVPEQYREQLLKAARESLALAAEGKLEFRDVGPLFDILRQYGGASAVTDLEQASSRWKYYSAIALADLPDGAGVPSLVQMVKSSPETTSANRAAALEALAQVSTQYPDAQEALLEQARTGKISNSSWMTVAAVLGGDKLQIGKVVSDDSASVGPNLKTYHLSSGNQDFYSTQNTAGWSSDEVTHRLALVDQLLALNAGPMATEALQRTRASLINRGQP